MLKFCVSLKIKFSVNYAIQTYHKFKFLIAMLLLIPLFWFGIKAGWNQADSDFPNYYVSAQLFLKSHLQEAYDVNKFNEHIQTYNKNAQGLFVMYPPSTSLVAIPLTHFDLLTAKKIWLLISFIALFGIVLLLTKLLDIDKIDAANLILASGFNLYNDFMLGQVYVVMIFFLLLGWYCLIRDYKITGGLCWAWVAAIKFLPLFFILVLLYKKHYKISFIVILGCILIHLFTFIVGGSMAYNSFLEVFQNNYLHGQVANEAPSSIQYQSMKVLLNLIDYNCHWPAWLLSAISICWKMSWITLAIYTCLKYLKTKHVLSVSFASITLLLLLFENGSATYHLLFCLFAIIAFLEIKIKLSLKIAIVLAYTMMGFVPLMVQQLNLQSLFLNFSRLWCLSLFAALFFMGLNNRTDFTK